MMPSVRMTYHTCLEGQKFRQDVWNWPATPEAEAPKQKRRKLILFAAFFPGVACLGVVLFIQRFLDGKLTAGAPDQLLRGGILQELEAEAKSVSLPRHRQHFHLPGCKRELQPNHLTQRHLVSQQGGDSRFADVDRIAPEHTLTASIDFDRHSQLVAGTASVFHKIRGPITCSRLSSHAAAFSRWNCLASQANQPGKSADSILIGDLLPVLYRRDFLHH